MTLADRRICLSVPSVCAIARISGPMLVRDNVLRPQPILLIPFDELADARVKAYVGGPA